MGGSLVGAPVVVKQVLLCDIGNSGRVEVPDPLLRTLKQLVTLLVLTGVVKGDALLKPP